MKHIRLSALALTIVTGLLMTTLFAGCGDEGEPVKVAVLDSGKSYTVEGLDGMTIQRLLEVSDIKTDGRDTIVPERGVKWRDAGAHAITIKRYAKVTVISGDERKDVELKGGTVELAISQAGYDAVAYECDQDKKAYVTDGMEIRLGNHIQGLVTHGDKSYYYDADGNLAKDGIVGSEADGYYYAGSDGAIDNTYSDGVNVGGTDYYVICGKATPVKTDADKVTFAAAQAIAKCTSPGMSKEQKLQKAFDYIKTNYNEGVRRTEPYYGMDWPVLYGSDLLIDGKGDCYSYGAGFAYMAKAIGYEEVYACNSGGHGWAEIDKLVYDPEWSMHHDDFTYFALSYDEETDVPYRFGISGGAEWMHIKV